MLSFSLFNVICIYCHFKFRPVERRKSSFADRLKAALERGNTPDSEGQFIRPSSTSNKKISKYSSSTGSDDSEYSFECGLNPDKMDTWVESAMLNLTSNEDVESANRIDMIKNYLNVNMQSGLSDSCLDIADKFEISSKGHLRYNQLRKDLKGLRERRALSCLIDDRNEPMHCKPKVKFDSNNNTEEGEDGNYYAWSIDSTSDPIEFLAMWISVSLSKLPLLVFQTNANEDLDQVFQVCSVIESQRQKLDQNGNAGSGNVQNLMKAVQLFYEKGIPKSELSQFVANFYENLLHN